MCGIIGAWYINVYSRNLSEFDKSLKMLSHRGPNDQGLRDFQIGSGQLVIGQTRLSVIDLGVGGHQPMLSPDGKWALVFNGEIYNYRELRSELQGLGRQFVSESDTEVLLQSWIEWGTTCVSRFCGMFVFVICDIQSGELFCVRDAFGIKPLYYSCTAEGLIFASELPALLSLLPQNPDLNLQRVNDYLVHGQYDDTSETFFVGVNQLSPGHILTLNLKLQCEPTLTRWWWPTIAENKDISFADAVLTLRALFLNSVRLHLRSDVPLGAALSGGIDSSAVVCAMRYLEPDLPIHTFSYIAGDSQLNEERWVDIVNAHVRANSHKIHMQGISLVDDLDDLIDAQGEPFGGTSIYAQYCVFQLVKETGVVVTLDGQGADELCAGYDGYPAQRLRSLLETRQFSSAINFVLHWSSWPGRLKSRPIASAVFSMLPSMLQGPVKQLFRRSFTPTWLNVKWLNEHGVSHGRIDRSGDLPGDYGRRVVAALRQTLTGRGLSALLRHGDRNSMHFSIESRVPFLTLEMAEFLLSLPESFLISDTGETKHVLRQAMRGIVPDVILDRKEKIGFETPELEFLIQCEPQAEKWLKAADSIPFLDARACRQELKAMLKREKRYSGEMWRLINFCRWTQRMAELRHVKAP